MRSCPGRRQTAPPEKKEQVQPSDRMRRPLPLLFVLLALLAAFAQAQDAPKESLVAKVQVFAQQAIQKTQERFTTLRESEAAQQAREWITNGWANAVQYFGRVKEKIATFLKTPAPAA
ncbi:apolipoprotein C-III-like isoform X2 [Podarcis raffonei]|uniref:apolipoprotein C-III-like isoform X2 n=1 Tax=Podarcis raffonei TaxID=65483 RepID=UPI002329866C|nr:apolipoprotein C-III-like isoform X2 [Podarcis raffonei]